MSYSNKSSQGRKYLQSVPRDTDTPFFDEEPELEQPKRTIRGILNKTDVLITCKEGDIKHVTEGDEPGIYLDMPKRHVCLLGGMIEVKPSPISESGAKSDSKTILVTHPKFPDKSVSATLTRTGKLKESYTDLDNFVITPTTTLEHDLVWRSLKALSIESRIRNPELYQDYVYELAWHNGEWVCVDGSIGATGVTYGSKIVAIAPRNWPQTVPLADSLPQVIDAESIRRLYNFWPRSMTMFPVALFGACSYITQPNHDGTARWELELFMTSGLCKTSVTNFIFRCFFGSGYTHGTHTQLHRRDSYAGRKIVLSKLPYHAYMSYDMNKKPGQTEYEKQQDDRIESLSMAGDSDDGPAKSNIDGKSLSERPRHKGLIIRVGESNPRIYTLEQKQRSPESRAVTYICESGNGMQKEFLEKSKSVSNSIVDLDAFRLAYIQWLASFSMDDQIQRYNILMAESVHIVTDEFMRLEYANAHNRRPEQLYDIVCGLLSLCQFLRAVDTQDGTYKHLISGGSVLASEMELDILPFIRERLKDSHDLMVQFDEIEGTSQKEAQASIILDAIRNSLTMGTFFLEPVPDNFRIDKEYLGLVEKKYRDADGNEHIEFQRRMSTSIRLGFIPPKANYVAIDKEPLESLIRALVRWDKRVMFTNMTTLLRELKEAGVIIGSTGRHVYDKQVSDPHSGKIEWKICILQELIWTDLYIQNHVVKVVNVVNVVKETDEIIRNHDFLDGSVIYGNVSDTTDTAATSDTFIDEIILDKNLLKQRLGIDSNIHPHRNSIPVCYICRSMIESGDYPDMYTDDDTSRVILDSSKGSVWTCLAKDSNGDVHGPVLLDGEVLESKN